MPNSYPAYWNGGSGGIRIFYALYFWVFLKAYLLKSSNVNVLFDNFPGNYENTRRLCTGAMCKLSCEERSPSCEGQPNGNNTFPQRELTPFYMTCLRERTLSVGVCRYGIYDPTLRYCTTDLDECKFNFFFIPV